MQVVVNGDKLGDNIGNVNPETNFVLTREKDASTENIGLFPIQIKFEENVDKKEDEYYNTLTYNLYQIRKQGNEEAEDDELELGWNNVSVNLLTKSDCFKQVGKAIEFTKDYTGIILVELYVSTSNGTYLVEWQINVSGILTMESTTADMGRLMNNGSPFLSGSSEKLINIAKQTGVGVTANVPTTFASSFVDTSDSVDKTGWSNTTSVYGLYKELADGSLELITNVDAKYNSSTDENLKFFFSEHMGEI